MVNPQVMKSASLRRSVAAGVHGRSAYRTPHPSLQYRWRRHFATLIEYRLGRIRLGTATQRAAVRPPRGRLQIFVCSARAGHRVMTSIRQFIEQRLRLLVNDDKSKVAPPAEVHFLGFRLCPNKTGQAEIHISPRTKQRLDDRIRELTPRVRSQSLNECLEDLNRYLRGWFGYFRICTAEGAKLFWRFDAHIRRRLRAIIVHRQKRPRYLYRHLVRHGVRKQTAAGCAYRRCGLWRRCNLHGITQAYPNAWFERRLVSLWSEWQRLHSDLPVSKQRLLFD